MDQYRQAGRHVEKRFPYSDGGIRQLTLVTAPIPEPAEWTMLIAGLLVIGFIARRRRELHG
jgi:hypothetical protein